MPQPAVLHRLALHRRERQAEHSHAMFWQTFEQHPLVAAFVIPQLPQHGLTELKPIGTDWPQPRQPLDPTVGTGVAKESDSIAGAGAADST
jgi:hypothetical protein